MDDNGVEDLRHLGGSGGTIQVALDALKQKKSSVDQVVDYCEGSYLVPGANKREVWLRTEEYLKDALGSVVTDIEDVAINLLDFVNAQADAVESVTSDVVVARTRLLRAREQSAATRLLALRRAAGEAPARQKIVVLTGSERPTKCRPLPPRKRISLKEKLGGIYADAPAQLSLSSDAATLAASAGSGDTSSMAETAELWGEHSPSMLGMSELPSPSVGGSGGTPSSPRNGFASPLDLASPGAKGGGKGGGGGEARKKEKGQLDLAAATRKAIAPVAAPVLAPPPPARDSVVMNKRLSGMGPRPGAAGAVGAPPPLVSRAKPGAPPPLLSQAGSGGTGGLGGKPPPPPPPALSSRSSYPGDGNSRARPPPPPPPPASNSAPNSSGGNARATTPPLPRPPPPIPRSAAAAPPPPPPPP
ncbi:unnamed protein product, partial [Laminaria digitata]